MPRTLRPEAFGPEYKELLLTVSRNYSYVMTLSSARDAYLLRIRVYSYFKALRAAVLDNPLYAPLVAEADKLKLSLDGAKLVFSPKSDHWDAIAIRTSLQLPPISLDDRPPNTESLLSRLSLIRKKKSK